MRSLSTIACLSLILTVSACQSSGYYDSNGVYHAYGAGDSYRHENAMGNSASADEDGQPYYNNAPAAAPNTTIIYTRPGYYDSNGYYIASGSGPHIDRAFLPPRGMCRVWFVDRDPRYQPAIESCNGIQSRVPTGAYVIYGG